MNRSPLVTLLVPIYNVERYLAECLDSILAQTMSDFEVICINDGSTDKSREIIQAYIDKDKRFKVIDKPNSGYGASMNMGLDAATGQYVGILESDDYFEPDALECLVEAAKKFDAQVVKANFWFYWSVPEPRNELFEVVTPDMANRLYDTMTEHKLFYRKNSIWSAIYRRDFLNENEIRFLETPGASYQDTAFDFKVWACVKRVTLLDKPILHYRQDNESSSVNSPSKVYCVCDEYDEIERFLDAHPECASLKGMEEKMKFDTYMWNYDRLTDDLAGEFIVRFSEDFKRDVDADVIDYSLFESSKREDLMAIVKSPEAYHAWRRQNANLGFADKAKLLAGAKGWKAVFSAAKRRMS